MENKKYTDMIFDVETFGNEGRFAVISVSFTPFNISSKQIGNPKLFRISLDESIKKGFTINNSTVSWWLNQNIEVLKNLLNCNDPIESSCYQIQEYLEEFEIDRFWASATLDYQAISNLFAECKIPNPIVYNKRLCLRTIRELSKTKQEYKHPTFTHNPTDDCRVELKELFDQLEILDIKF
jgi:hypothetical protein